MHQTLVSPPSEQTCGTASCMWPIFHLEYVTGHSLKGVWLNVYVLSVVI